MHQYNLDALLRMCLPYHDSNAFVRLFKILEIPETDARLSWLRSFQKSDVPLRRQVLLNRSLSDLAFLQFLCETIEYAIKVKCSEIVQNAT